MHTWADIEQAALNDPLLYRMVTHVERGDLTREQALLEAVLACSDDERVKAGHVIGHICEGRR